MTIKKTFQQNKMSLSGKVATTLLVIGMGLFGAAIYQHEKSHEQDLNEYHRVEYYDCYEMFAEESAIILGAGILAAAYSARKQDPVNFYL